MARSLVVVGPEAVTFQGMEDAHADALRGITTHFKEC
jgi:hypothetical protein